MMASSPVAQNHHPARKAAAPRRAARAAAAPLLLLVILAGFYWKLLFSNQYTWLESPDIANQVLPWYQFQAREWHQGRFPLWDPHHWGGQPLLAQGQPGAAYPLNWLLFLMPLRNGVIRQGYLHWYYVLIHYMAALFCYWLARDLGRGRAASLLAGLAWALAGWMGATDWPQMLNGAVWAPLVFLFLLRALRGERPLASGALAGAVLGVAFLSGHHQAPLFLTLVAAGVWVYGIARDRRLLLPAAVSGVFLFLAGSFQTLPAYRYGKLALRWVGTPDAVGWNQVVPYRVHAEYSMDPSSVLGILIAGVYKNADPFLGVVVVTLALAGLLAAWREPAVRFFAAVAGAGLLLALGGYSVFHGMAYALLPLVEKARNPSMAIFIFHLAFCILLAYGIDTYQRSPKLLTRAVALVGGMLFALLLALRAARVPTGIDSEKLALAGLAAIATAAVLAARRADQLSARAAAAAVGVLLLFEAGAVRTTAWAHRDEVQSWLKKIPLHADIARFVRSQPGPARIDYAQDEIPYNFGDWYGVDAYGGYLASLTSNVQRVKGRAPFLFAAGLYAAREPLRPGQAPVFESASGLKVFSNPEAFPRVWVVHDAVTAAREADVERLLGESPAVLRRRAFLRGPVPPLQSCSGADRADVTRHESNRVTIDAALECAGMVILAETYVPGWRAWVDGRETPVYETYGALRGVAIPAGRHQIDMRYRPPEVFWGAGLTAAGLAAALLIWIFVRR